VKTLFMPKDKCMQSGEVTVAFCAPFLLSFIIGYLIVSRTS
jgi:hypothetical protein